MRATIEPIHLIYAMSVCGLLIGMAVFALVCSGRLLLQARAVSCYGVVATVAATAPALVEPGVAPDAAGVVGLLMAFMALGVAFVTPKPLVAYLTQPRQDEEPSWWPAFERAFWKHVRTPPHDLNPFRAAVVRRRQALRVRRSRQLPVEY